MKGILDPHMLTCPKCFSQDIKPKSDFTPHPRNNIILCLCETCEAYSTLHITAQKRGTIVEWA